MVGIDIHGNGYVAVEIIVVLLTVMMLVERIKDTGGVNNPYTVYEFFPLLFFEKLFARTA